MNKLTANVERLVEGCENRVKLGVETLKGDKSSDPLIRKVTNVATAIFAALLLVPLYALYFFTHLDTVFKAKGSNPPLSENGGAEEEIEPINPPPPNISENLSQLPHLPFGEIQVEERSYEAPMQEHYAHFSESHFSNIANKRQSAINRQRRNFHVAIVGGGPSGLIAAFEAYARGQKVTLIEKRENYTRDQILRLSTETYQFLKEVLGPPIETFLGTEELLISRTQNGGNQRLFPDSDFYTIEARDLEKSLYILIEAIAKRDPESMILHRSKEVIGIKPPESSNHPWKLEILDPSSNQTVEIGTDLVVGADGVNSRVRELGHLEVATCSNGFTYGAATFSPPFGNPIIFSSLDRDIPQIVYDGAEISEREGKEGILKQMKEERRRTDLSAELEVLAGTAPSARRIGAPPLLDLEFVRLGQEAHLAFLKREFGWEMDRLPISRFFTSKDTVYLGCEFPPSLLASLQGLPPEEIEGRQIAWHRAVLKAHLPQSMIDQLIPKHGDAFYLDLKTGSSPIKKLEHLEVPLPIVLIGDAYVTPHFLTGSGAQHAIMMARAFGDLITKMSEDRDPSTSQAPFIQAMNASANDLHQKAYREGILSPLQNSNCYRDA